jgi:hypothetical protein
MNAILAVTASVMVALAAPGGSNACTEACTQVCGESGCGSGCIPGKQGFDCQANINGCSIETTGCGGDSFITQPNGTVLAVLNVCDLPDSRHEGD